ncbi:pyrroline-5-carboxylate reductase [Natranaerobius trueperi]|nr:pyrroline-5-carboxylate reductase [Natranaerobius trueperi]
MNLNNPNLKVGVIGVGNMGQSLIKGFIDSKTLPAENVVVFNRSKEKVINLQESHNVTEASSIEELVDQCNVIFLSIKPQDLSNLLENISNKDIDNKIFVSVVVGVSISFIEEKLDSTAKVIRLMPNTPCLIGHGVTAMAYNNRTDNQEIKLVSDLVKSTGEVIEVSEEQMDAVTGLSGSGPAYVFMLIQALTSGGVKQGLSHEQSKILAAQTVQGAAKMVLETDKHPEELKDMVSSPGGTTIQAVQYLEDNAIRGAFMKAVELSSHRAYEIKQGSQQGNDDSDNKQD